MIRENATVETKGGVVRRVVDGLSDLDDELETRGRAICRRHGVKDPDPESWYPLDDVLELLRELTDELGREPLVHFGTKIPEQVVWPDGIETVSEGFESIDEAYRMNHRGGSFGFYEFTQTEERAGVVGCENPYPCPFDEGVIKGTLWAFSDRFAYKPLIFIRETSDHCRMDGGRRCEYRVSW